LFITTPLGRNHAQAMYTMGRNDSKWFAEISNGRRYHTIPKVRFDAVRCARGIDCLKSYQAEWSEELRVYKKTPLHDWSSHGADAFRYLSLAWREPIPDEETLSPLEMLRREAARGKTWNELWASRAARMADEGIEVDDDDAIFNLSDPDNNLTMD
jgi:hypothetical protein